MATTTHLDSRRAGHDAPRPDRDRDFADYMRSHQARLLRTAYLLTGDQATAEDLVQVTLVKLYLAWDRVASREAVHGYARRILVNENNSRLRRAWRRREVTVAVVPERSVAPDHDLTRAVWDFVCSLPPRQRAVVVLRYYEDLDEDEIAQTLGISVGTVRSQASRALASLRSRVHDAPGLQAC